MNITKDQYLKLLTEGDAKYDGNVIIIDAGVLGKLSQRITDEDIAEFINQTAIAVDTAKEQIAHAEFEAEQAAAQVAQAKTAYEKAEKRAGNAGKLKNKYVKKNREVDNDSFVRN